MSSFFRDANVFETLKRSVFAQLLRHKDERAPIRVWAAGCSTGEEAYSLAFCLLEFLADRADPRLIQVFGSDVSARSIQTARVGAYSQAAVRGVTEDRLRRFFDRTNTGFRVKKRVRDVCLFVRHDLTRDPPFSKIDLVSCRNVFRRFDQSLQERILPTFHFSLNNPGFLWLGRSEGIVGSGDLFVPVSRAGKVFARTTGPGRLHFVPGAAMGDVLDHASAARSPVASRVPRARANATSQARLIAKLEDERSAATEYLRSLLDERSYNYEGLATANEELAAGNEELQSLNEELETAKEELEAANQALTTVNDELRARNLEVAQINHDLKSLIDTIDVPLVILDRQRRIRRFTPQVGKVLNLRTSDVGRPLADTQAPIDLRDLDEQVAKVMETSVVREWEVRNGDGRWYRLVVRPYQADAEVAGAIVSLLDIQTFKDHLSEVQRAREEAERADNAKDQFLAVVSHELRTPLASLLMQTQLLRQAGSDEARRERACAGVERSTHMQVKLVDDLLDVSRIVTGKMRIDLKPCGLAGVVQSALDQVAALVARKSIELIVSVDQFLDGVAGDRIRLEQVVLNLVGNAVKFTDPGGKVFVSLKGVDGLAHLEVTDTGIGIEADFLPHIFERLTQHEASSTRSHSGLGLGLAIVRHIVDAHGGTVRAESAGPGMGASFHVVLPLIAAPVAALPDVARTAIPTTKTAFAEIADKGHLAGRRILLVEDDAGIREALAEALALTGAIVRSAESSAAGLALFRRFRPQAILCDIAMPLEDGYGFIGRIRALGPERGGDIPALALTALAGEADRRRALSAGFQMYLAKPVPVDRLTSTMAELLRLGRAVSFSRSRKRRKVPQQPTSR